MTTFIEELTKLTGEIYGIGFNDGNDGETAYDRLVEIDKAILNLVSERIIGGNEPLVIPEYPAVDDEGEPLYSKRAAKEGRKQVTARYHSRKELRNEQRTTLYEGTKEETDEQA